MGGKTNLLQSKNDSADQKRFCRSKKYSADQKVCRVNFFSMVKILYFDKNIFSGSG